MSRRVIATCLVLASLIGCSDPPTKERDQAEGALAAARAAEAAVYASGELQAAEAALRRYDDAVAQRDYRQALSFALDARDRAYEAARQAGNEKALARSRAETLVGDVTRLTTAAEARLAATPRLSGPAAERLRQAVRGTVAPLADARGLIDRQDFRGAIVRLTPAVEDLRREMTSAEGGRRGRGPA